MNKPSWLKRRIESGPGIQEVLGIVKNSNIHTVCQEARCPNLGECFSQKTATFLILGNCCTRNCRFCAVKNGVPGKPDPKEPALVAEAAKNMGLHYVVITSVTRDDLSDGGAAIYARTIQEIRKTILYALIEVLIPDFMGQEEALRKVAGVCPDVINHNIETVSRLYSSVRPQAGYRRSLWILSRIREINPHIHTKSGIMLGLGEEPEEIRHTMQDLLSAGCQILTIGQYLQPSKDHLKVQRFVTPEEFEYWRKTAQDMGFSAVTSGPFVRSSYHAGEIYRSIERIGMSTC
jgi:lipoic acid synthetase